MELTDEQRRELGQVWLRSPRDATQDFCDAYHAILQTSKTYRIVEAPEGFEFGYSSTPRMNSDNRYATFGFNVMPIPKPCPPPKLDPVTVTAESVYGKLPASLADGKPNSAQLKT